VASRLEGLDQLRFLVGSEAAIDVDLLDSDSERLIAELGNFRPRQDSLGTEPDQAGQPLDDKRIVAR
jgi:hypothetical protein